jgi:hypothetical protein
MYRMMHPLRSDFFYINLEDCSDIWIKKKESRLTPTFVNLKSNTMKNTVQR